MTGSLRSAVALTAALIVGVAVVAAWPQGWDAAVDRGGDAGDLADPGEFADRGDHAGDGPGPEPTAAPDDELLLVWTAGGLPEGIDQRLAVVDEVAAHTVIAGDLVELAGARAADGTPVDDRDDDRVIPLDVLAIDPAGYADVVGVDALAGLDEGEAALSATSARLRDLDHGATLTTVGGEELTVVGVADDAAVGHAEVVVTTAAGDELGVTTDRYALVTYDGDRDEVEQAVRDQLPDDVPVRLRAPGEARYLRHGDAVLPQVLVKERFGEFAYRRYPDGHLTPDAAWRHEHLVETHVPLLGELECHRRILDDLVDALETLAERGLDHLIDADGFGGCYHPRLTRSGESVSRHAWGIAVDINVPDNPAGTSGNQDPRLVEVFEEHGFTWGGDWLVPDPHHFEHVGSPR